MNNDNLIQILSDKIDEQRAILRAINSGECDSNVLTVNALNESIIQLSSVMGQLAWLDKHAKLEY